MTARTKIAGSNFGDDWNGQRCGAHGGAKGSGAPSGERNGAYKHGRFTGSSLGASSAALRVVGKRLTARENGNIALEQYLPIEAGLGQSDLFYISLKLFRCFWRSSARVEQTRTAPCRNSRDHAFLAE